MQKEPSYELLGIQCHDLFLVTIGVVTPEECYPAVFNLEYTLIADGYPVGIAAQVLKNSINTVKRWLAVNDPFLMVELP